MTKRPAAFWTAILVVLSCAQPALAETKLRWSLQAEDWVETATAEVSVAVSVSDKTTEAASNAAYGLVDRLRAETRADWRVIARHGATGEDRSGLHSWTLEVMARIDVRDYQNVERAVGALSVPGRNARVSRTNMMPSLAETEAAREKVRAAMIGRAEAQAKALGATLVSVDFDPQTPASPPQPLARVMHAEMAMAADGGGPRTGSMKIVETALIEALKP
ncbi:MAG: SIMPL domain-containing protein [Alphaproteobacteria bacterium]|nr:SIMPL domain-containing protein [Alphaproteobacteria bacterium]